MVLSPERRSLTFALLRHRPFVNSSGFNYTWYESLQSYACMGLLPDVFMRQSQVWSKHCSLILLVRVCRYLARTAEGGR